MFGGGGKCEDGSVVGEEVVSCGGVIGCWVVCGGIGVGGCEVGGDSGGGGGGWKGLVEVNDV